MPATSAGEQRYGLVGWAPVRYADAIALQTRSEIHIFWRNKSAWCVQSLIQQEVMTMRFPFFKRRQKKILFHNPPRRQDKKKTVPLVASRLTDYRVCTTCLLMPGARVVLNVSDVSDNGHQTSYVTTRLFEWRRAELSTSRQRHPSRSPTGTRHNLASTNACIRLRHDDDASHHSPPHGRR